MSLILSSCFIHAFLLCDQRGHIMLSVLLVSKSQFSFLVFLIGRSSFNCNTFPMLFKFLPSILSFILLKSFPVVLFLTSWIKIRFCLTHFPQTLLLEPWLKWSFLKYCLIVQNPYEIWQYSMVLPCGLCTIDKESMETTIYKIDNKYLPHSTGDSILCNDLHGIRI